MRWYASCFVLFVCGSLIALDAWLAWNNRDTQLEAAKISVTNLTRALAQHAEDTIKKTDTILFGLVERLEVDGMQQPTLRRLYPLLAARVHEMPQLLAIFIYDEHGHWLVNSLSDVPTYQNNSDRAYFTYHRDHPDRGPYISAPVHSRNTGEWVIPVSRRINHANGSFAGIALASIKMSYFNQYYASFDIGKTGAILLALSNATLVVRRPYQETLIGRNIHNNPLFTELAKQHTLGTMINTSTIDDIERLSAYQRLERYPLVISAALSKQEVLASWREETLHQSLAVLLMVLMVALLGTHLIKQIGTQERIRGELFDTQKQLLAFNKTLQHLALQDSLTGLANRRQFDLTLHAEFDRAVREQRSIAMLMIDIDYFKRYNDMYGHPEGDRCLRQVAEAVQSKRPGDFSARYGGEEFAVVLAETDLKGALVVAEAIRQAVRALYIVHTGNPSGYVTISIGVTATVPSARNNGPLSFLKTADAALYAAKAAGRNTVCSATLDSTNPLETA